MKPQRVIVILNKGSGRQDGTERKSRISDRFQHHDIPVSFVEFSPNGADLGQVAQSTAEANPDATIVASGGDGTISGVASGLAHVPNQMGIIPAGTFNYFARSLNLPETVDEAVDVIAKGVLRPTDIAKINGNAFLNNASIGAYAAILKTREGIYDRWGRSRVAAYWSVVKALATLRAPLRLTRWARIGASSRSAAARCARCARRRSAYGASGGSPGICTASAARISAPVL